MTTTSGCGRCAASPRPRAADPGRRGLRRRALLLGAALAWLPAQGADREIDQALRAAAARDDLAGFKALLAEGADVNARDTQQDSAFLIAARNGHTALVQAALAAGADLKALNRFGSTALMGPAYRGHVETVRVLIGTPIDLHHVNNLGWTALLEAIVLGTDGPRHREIVRMLITSGSDVQARDRDGVSALQHAQRRGQAEVARMLRDAGAK
jgi:ankyrin repeat protein